MGANDVPIVRSRHGANYRPALARRRRSPVDRETLLRTRIRMGSQADMVRAIGTSHQVNPEKTRARRCDGPNGKGARYLNFPPAAII